MSTYKERYEERKKQRESQKSASSYKDRYMARKIESGELDSNEITSRIDTWFENHNNYINNYNSRYSTRKGTYEDSYVSDSGEWLDTISAQKSNFDKEASAIMSYLDQYGDYFGKEYTDSVKNAFQSALGQQSEILKQASSDKDFWSQFADENEYLGYQREYKKQKRYEGYAEKYAGKTYEDILAATNKLIGDEEKEWLKNEAVLRYDLNAAQEEIGRLTSILDVKDQITKIKQEESTLKLAIAKGDKNAAEKLAKNNQRLEALNSTWDHALSTYGSEDDLNSLLSSKSMEYTIASRAQKAAELASVADNDPQFSNYSELGKNISYEEVGSTKKQNGATIYDDLKAATLALNEHQLGTELYNESMRTPGEGLSGYFKGLKGLSEYNTENSEIVETFRKMNEREFATLAYYLKKDEENGTDLAAQYIDSIRQTLNTRVASDIAEAKEGKLLQQYAFAVGAGIDQFFEGRDAFFSGEDNIIPSATQIASGIIREDLAETGKKVEWLGGVSLGQLGYDALNTTANMLPSMLAGAVTNIALPGAGTAIGSGFLGMSAGGNAKAEMLRLGYSKEQATSYGLLVGIAEAGMEYLLGHIPGLSKGNGLFSTFGTKVASKVDNAISRVAITLGDKGTDILRKAAGRAIGAVGGALDEALEEGLQTIIESWLKEMATSVDWDAPNVDEVLYSSLLGAITSLGMGGAQNAIQDVITSFVQNAEAKKNYGVGQRELVAKAVEIDPSNKFAQRMQAKVDNGKNLTGAQLNRLVKQNNNTLTAQEGNTDTINAEAYGRMVAELDAEESSATGSETEKVQQVTGKLPASKADSQPDTNVGDKMAQTDEVEASKSGKGDIRSVEVNGDRATFTLLNGEKVGLDKVAFKSENERLVANIAVERVSRVKGFTNEAATAMIKGYDGSISPSQYMTAFDEAYEMGATGTPSSKLTGAINSGISERVAFTAYVLGKNTKNAESILNSESKNGIINTNINESEAGYESGENLHLRNSGERVGSQNTQGQISRVESGAGQAESGGENVRIADSEAARLLNEGREVKVADLGILGGSNEQTVRLVDKANETSSMKEARKNAEARGLKVRFFVGDNLVIKDGGGKWISARAYIKGEHVFIRADHPLYTADQLMRHELGHDMIAKGEVDIAAVRERLQKTVGKENIDEVARLYSDAYAGTGMSAEEIWEECICDSLGDMNIFAGAEAIGEFIDLALPEIKAAASETKAPTQTRGSPEGKASRTPLRGRSIEIETMENNRFDRLREFRDDLPNVWYARTYDYFYVYSNRSFTDYTIIKKIKITDANSQLINAIEGALKDEINGDTKTFNDWLKSFRSGKRSHSGNNANASGGRSAGTVDGMDGGARRSEAGNDPSDSNGNSRITGETESKYSSPEEAKASGKVSDAKFSIEFADDIANKQRKYAADGLSRISSEELEKAIADTAHMVNEMKPYANILPQDKVGKTLVKNGSYDVSVENTTVCIRTLAYNSFVDMVSEKVGRPLTQMESFLVSQKLYEIAKEPQCLYCYVSLDRKAFNEMVIRYTEQRDAAISAYEAAGKPEIPKKFNAEWSLFKEFLAGRKPTTNMWDRYVGWINAHNKGERLVSLSDISTEAKRLELVEGGGEIASQVKDILKYAQSASWAKKQTQYVAYYDEILKLKPAVIRNLNNHYGMRWYSFSDYSGAFIVENMQQITDAAIRGLKGLSYTKDTDFAEIFAPTGMNINISVYAKKTADGGYEIDAKQSANIEEAIKLREQYPNVGIVVVATDKAGVEWALAQEWSDVVIPFHTVRTGADVAEFYNWEIFNAEQNDTVSDQNLWDAYTRDVGKKKASKMVYPSEHQNNRETYLSICEQRGLTPRFKSFLGNPNYMKLVNETRQSESQTSPLKAVYNLEAAERSFDKFVEKGGYYEGWYNDGIDVDGESDIVAEDVIAGKKANEVSYGRQDINFEDVAKGRKTNRQHGKASRELDTEYLSAVNRGDMETAQKMVDEAAREAGYDSPKLYHGTPLKMMSASKYKLSASEYAELDEKYDDKLFPFVVFKTEKGRSGLTYTATSKKAAENFAYPRPGTVFALYGKFENPLVVNEHIYDSVPYYYEVPTPSVMKNAGISKPTLSTEEIAHWAKANGYDGVIVEGLREGGGDYTDDYIMFSSSQLKSADPVTYDDNGKVIPLSERFNTENDDIRYSRELDFLDFMEQQTDREVLANAFESVAQNDVEKAKLKDYRENIGKLNAEEEKLMKLRAEIKELSFAKGARDISKIAELRTEAEKTANRIGIYDKRLLTLEASKPLRAVLEREKQKSYNRAKAEARADFDKYRARAQKSQEELKARYQESKRRGVEGRHKTEVRHKIQGIVSELNTLLLNPTAKKHIKEELRRGVAEALSAFNMDTVGAEERLAEINRKLQKETDPYEIERLLESYRRIQNQGANLQEKLEKLNTAYEKIKDSDDIELNLAYQEVIQNSIKAVSEKVGDTSIRDMTLEQLEMVYDLFKMIRHTIRDANKAFKTKKGETITQMADKVNHEVRTVGGQPYQRNAVSATLQRIGWTFLKPYVAFRTIGSETLVDRYRELREGEDTFYSDIREAQTFIEEQYEKYGFKSWDMKETREFKAKSGKSFELTLEQMMTLYAYSKREQAHAHIMEGGIVFEDALVVKKNKLGVPIKYEVTTKDAFNLSEEIFADIANTLTDEQKAFVDSMQEYLSSTMGAKGNEVSMQLVGVKLFKEKFYLPIKSSQYYMNFKSEEAGEVKLRSPAFSKETVKHANNPIVLHNFTDLWAEHINDMAMYHSFVLALEDFTRVYNYKTKTGADTETMDTKATLETAYPGVTKYINKFLKDMNGGIRGETVGWAEKMTSLAKKGSVLGSASVTIQQPSAIMRAMAYINPKYFVGEKVSEGKHKQKWEELKKYAPIAGIKEMGRFDVGMGQSTSDWIKADKNKLEKAEEVISLPPAKMDEVTWLAIWNAVKRETAHNYPKLETSSEEFLTLAGERFTDVISLSQVYDSVFSRSDIMRNKSWIAKSLTAFMAEPTTTLNMLWDSAVQGKRTGSAKGFVATTASTGGAVFAAVVFNSLLKSFVMAMRDDDEDESYAEKYLEHFVGDLKDNLNPLNLIPFVKDILSIFKGYDVERMDMALFSDLKNAIDAFDSDSKTLYEKWSGFIGAASAFFGIPIKNIERDVRALFNTFFGKREETTLEGMLYAIEKSWFGEQKSKGQQLYEAMLKGDEKHIERLRARFDSPSDISAAIKKGLRENDMRVKAAARMLNSGDIRGFADFIDTISGEGIFDGETVEAAIRAEASAFNSKIKDAAEAKRDGKTDDYIKIVKELRESYRGVYSQDEIVEAVNSYTFEDVVEDDVEEVESVYKNSDINSALESGDTETASEIIKELIDVKTENNFFKAQREAEESGKRFKEKEARTRAELDARSSIRSSLTSYWKKRYIAAYESGNEAEINRISELLYSTGIYGNRKKYLDEVLEGWLEK